MHIEFLCQLRAKRYSRQRSLLPFIRCLLLLLLLCLCKDVLSQKNIAASTTKKIYYGVASFYNKHMEGEMTATGETFHHSLLTAASNNFALNSWIRITNLKNGKSVIVRINDHMSKSMQALGRIADMTRSAAQQLDILSRGLARVKVEEITHW